MKRTVKFLRHPTFTAAEWANINPYLAKGEEGFVLEGALVIGGKVGPGFWNDLPFNGGEVYPYPEAPTNPIGDAKGVLLGKKSTEILHLMLNPYQAAALNNILNNANGSYQAAPVREIGNPIPGPVVVSYSISNAGNVVGATPINVSAGGLFTNEGPHPTGPISLTLASPLNPANPVTYTINLTLTHTQGTSPGSTSIRFHPKLMWAVSNNPALDAGTFMAIASKSTLVSNVYKRNYNFGGSGYSYVLIPMMLNPSGLVFTDMTDPNAPAGYSMEDMGSLTVNNGVGTYDYLFLRSTFLLINPTILKVS